MAYAPLPSIVRAARQLFHNRPLPFIKRARARTEPALKYITSLAHEAAKTRQRHFQEMPPELQSFIVRPANINYLETAMRLSEMDVEKLRTIAASILEITY